MQFLREGSVVVLGPCMSISSGQQGVFTSVIYVNQQSTPLYELFYFPGVLLN